MLKGLWCSLVSVCVLSVVIAAWWFVGQMGHQHVTHAVAYMSGTVGDGFDESIFDGSIIRSIGSFFWGVWLWIRLFLIVLIGVGVTAIGIGVMVITGSMAWMVKQLAVGVGNAYSFIRSQFSNSNAPAGNSNRHVPVPSVGDLVVATVDGRDVTVNQVLDEFQSTLNSFGKRIERVEQGGAGAQL